MKRLLLASSLSLLLIGCATTATTSTTAPVAAVETPAQVAAKHALDEAAERARADAGLTGAERNANLQAIVRLLGTLDNATLQREAAALPASDPLYPFVGRALLNRGLSLPKEFARGQHAYGSAQRLPAEADGYRPPLKVAVLLPLSGTLAAAARPVRDGFLAGYYAETRRRPALQFIDTAKGVNEAYAQAVAGGNDLVVGPLGRGEVETLFANNALSVPVLALNRPDTRMPQGHVSFSLSPEDEGVALANLLLERGARRVVVVGPEDDTQTRAVRMLTEILTARGGQVLVSLPAGTTALPTMPAATDVDAIVFATRSAGARALLPQLALAGLSEKPRFATSVIVSGTGKPAEDMLLNGIVYPGEAWSSRSMDGIGTADGVGVRLPSARGAAGRLFAFGVDAWKLTGYLDRLASDHRAGIEGATGTLRVDGFGNVLRTPAWLTFRAADLPVTPANGR